MKRRFFAIGYYPEQDEPTIDFIDSEYRIDVGIRLHSLRKTGDWKFLFAYTAEELRTHADNMESETAEEIETCLNRLSVDNEIPNEQAADPVVAKVFCANCDTEAVCEAIHHDNKGVRCPLCEQCKAAYEWGQASPEATIQDLDDTDDDDCSLPME